MPKPTPAWIQALQRRLALWNRRRLRRRHLARQRPYAAWCAEHDQPLPSLQAAWRAAVQALGDEAQAELLLVADAPDAAGLLPTLQAQSHSRWRLRVAITARAPGERARWQALVATEPRVLLSAADAPDRTTALSALLRDTTAPWCALLDRSERWREHTLLALLGSLTPEALLVYGDEDRQDGAGPRHDPWFKPRFDPDALLAMDSLGAPALWRTEALRARLGPTPLQAGAERHDLALRGAWGLHAGQVVHVPGVLAHRGSAACTDAAAAARAVQAALDRSATPARAEPDADPAAARAGLVRVRFAVPQPPPHVSIVIPTRNGLALLRHAVGSLLARTTWPAFDIVIVDNGSDDPACLRWLAEVVRDPRIRVRRDERAFNFAALNNAAVAEARGEVIALVNNDVELLTPGWLEEMATLALRPGIGAVGARLWYEDGTLQHGGVLLGIGEVAAHTLKGLPRGEGGPAARALRLQSYLAVTAACLVVSRANWQRVGGMDEGLAVAFNDVDFCLKLAAAGLRNLWTPHAEMLHFESVSRGRDHGPAKKARYLAEAAVMLQRWGPWIADDPFYNPNLSAAHDDFSLAEPPRSAKTG